MIEKEYRIADGNLRYQISKQGIIITGFTGTALQVTIPSEIDGTAVVAIAKKAFLSKKNLKNIALPASVREVGDWAFAYCDGLERIVLQSRCIRFGKSVFLECGGLKKIDIEGMEAFVAPLMAAAVCAGAYYLLDMSEVGSDEWISKWDLRLMTVLDTPDNEGYSKQVLCGEEDYGSTDLEAYKSNSRRRKLRMAFIRLLNPYGLSTDNRERLVQYALSHTKGCESEESWEIILAEHGNDRDYYELFARLGCVDAGNISGILADIGEDYPEMKAFFIRYNGEHSDGKDFFDALDL